MALNVRHNFLNIIIMKGLLLKPGPRPWTRTLKNLDYEKRGKQLDAKKKD